MQKNNNNKRGKEKLRPCLYSSLVKFDFTPQAPLRYLNKSPFDSFQSECNRCIASFEYSPLFKNDMKLSNTKINIIKIKLALYSVNRGSVLQEY